MTMANGLITVPNSEGNNVWAVPGTQMFFMGAYPSEPGFTVTDVSQDATNTYILTTWKADGPRRGGDTGSEPWPPRTSGAEVHLHRMHRRRRNVPFSTTGGASLYSTANAF